MGGEDTLKSANAGEEPIIPAFADLLRVYNARSLSASEVMKVRIIVYSSIERNSDRSSSTTR
ncbi:conserved hypothetical protein [Verticillium alfalfae VaMs.102]|uniref:Uncharacterized protein n=1 Tax=Verticillium alfalfae (strain VaMs.102 / ATCC MYA-4576 / FGSC 10136) TaxID=526221 RepID=C9SEH9_VERA1|nr:conserved hypothetical protein [Verticillium alfalfae VaMs.102]EEY16572.1 conserved hypothetical protein [Verticillium alfalfae VaMs.102]